MLSVIAAALYVVTHRAVLQDYIVRALLQLDELLLILLLLGTISTTTSSTTSYNNSRRSNRNPANLMHGYVDQKHAVQKAVQPRTQR